MRTIVILDEAFGQGFDVTIAPPPADEQLAREFRSHADAVRYAQQLADGHGWTVVDRSCEAQR